MSLSFAYLTPPRKAHSVDKPQNLQLPVGPILTGTLDKTDGPFFYLESWHMSITNSSENRAGYTNPSGSNEYTIHPSRKYEVSFFERWRVIINRAGARLRRPQ